MPISSDEFDDHDPGERGTNIERVLRSLVRNRELVRRRCAAALAS